MNSVRTNKEYANISDQIDANGIELSSTAHRHDIIGEVEIIKTTRQGKARFTKTIHRTNDLLIGGANFFSEKANNMRSSFSPTPIDVEYGIHTIDQLTIDSESIKNEAICGMTIGIDGCVNTYNTVKPVLTHSRIVPGMIPFRKMKLEEEALLKDEERAKYFMRVVDASGYVNYYGKKFDATPTIYNLFEDGTEVPSSISTIAEPKAIKHYTKYILTIEGKDVREYFKIRDRSTSNSKVNSAGLVASYPGLTADGEHPEWFNVRQLTTLNFENQELKDSESMLTFIYRMNIR